MSLWTKAIISGITIEAVLFYVMYWAGGPMTSLGAVFALFHFPAFILVMPFSSAEMSKSTSLTLIFIAASLWWTMITYAFLVARRRK